MANRDSYVNVARETVYGTYVAGTRSFEAEGDPARRVNQYLERQGLRAGRETRRSAEVRTIGLGAEGTLPLTVMQSGFGMLFRAMLDNAAIAQVGATDAWLQTFESTQQFGSESLSLQVVRGKESGTKAFTYPGTVVSAWELTQAVDEYLKLNLTLDSQDEETATAAAAAVYPADNLEYAWPDLVVTIDGTEVPARSLTISANRGLDTERRRLRGSRLKQVPVRTADPEYGIELELDYTDETFYDLFVSGETVPVVAEWTGAVVDSPETAFLRVTLAEVQWRGETPQVDASGAEPTQPLTGVALDDDSQVAVTIEYQSADTAA